MLRPAASPVSQPKNSQALPMVFRQGLARISTSAPTVEALGIATSVHPTKHLMVSHSTRSPRHFRSASHFRTSARSASKSKTQTSHGSRPSTSPSVPRGTESTCHIPTAPRVSFCKTTNTPCVSSPTPSGFCGKNRGRINGLGTLIPHSCGYYA